MVADDADIHMYALISAYADYAHDPYIYMIRNIDKDAPRIKMQPRSRCTMDEDATSVKMLQGSKCYKDQDATRIKIQQGSRCNVVVDQDAMRIKSNEDQDATRIKSVEYLEFDLHSIHV